MPAGSVRPRGERNADRVATIDMTLGGNWLAAKEKLIQELYGRDALRSLWQRMSAAFAANASGEVFAFTSNARPDSIWNTVERPILEGKASIKINYMPKSPCG